MVEELGVRVTTADALEDGVIEVSVDDLNGWSDEWSFLLMITYHDEGGPC